MAAFEWLRGTADFRFDSPQARDGVLSSFIGALAACHALDPFKLDLPELDVGRGDHGAELADLDAYRLMSTGDAARNCLILGEAMQWLAINVPSRTPDLVLTHGDAGPGNFLHDGHHITGLIDWELAHIGDPMDDLAWLWFRLLLHGSRGLEHCYRRYAEITGRRLDLERLTYYRVFVLLRCALATTIIHSKRPRVTRYERGAEWLRTCLGQALAEAGVVTEATRRASVCSRRPLPPLPASVS
jgi:aminoglycoside phosphotransferase (APT) family kinase protein